MNRSRKSVCFIGLGLIIFATGCPVAPKDTEPPCPDVEKTADVQRDVGDDAIGVTNDTE